MNQMKLCLWACKTKCSSHDRWVYYAFLIRYIIYHQILCFTIEYSTKLKAFIRQCINNGVDNYKFDQANKLVALIKRK